MPEAQTSPIRLVLATLLLTAAAAATVPAVLALAFGVSTQLQLRSLWTALASSFIHFGILAWLAAILLVGAAVVTARRGWLALLAVPLAIGLAWQLSWVLPLYRSSTLPHQTPLSMTVLNMQNGRADLDELLANSAGSDVMVLIEITDEAQAALTARGFDRSYPYHVHRGFSVGGTSVYSRFPMVEVGSGDTVFGSPLVRIQHDTGPILVLGAHPVNALNGVGTWVNDARSVRKLVQPHLAEPLVLAGDFNSIDRHATFRPFLEEDGLRMTSEITGAGLQRTWPMRGSGSRFGPLLGIDHVLVSPSMTAVSHDQFRISGTDHAGLRVEVAKRA